MLRTFNCMGEGPNKFGWLYTSSSSIQHSYLLFMLFSPRMRLLPLRQLSRAYSAPPSSATLKQQRVKHVQRCVSRLSQGRFCSSFLFFVFFFCVFCLLRPFSDTNTLADHMADGKQNRRSRRLKGLSCTSLSSAALSAKIASFFSFSFFCLLLFGACIVA